MHQSFQLPGCETARIKFDIALFMFFKVAADVKMWGADGFALPEHQGNQHSADASVAVLKGVQRLEFQMGNGGINQNRSSILINIIKQFIQPFFPFLRGMGTNEMAFFLPLSAK